MNEALKLITMFSLLGKHHYYLASDIAPLMRTIREAAEAFVLEPYVREDFAANTKARALILNATEQFK